MPLRVLPCIRAPHDRSPMYGMRRALRWIRVERPLERWWPWGILHLAGFVLLVFFALFSLSHSIESDVAQQVRSRLEAAGYSWVNVQSDGQSITLRNPTSKTIPEPFLYAIVRTTECSTPLGPRICPTDVHIETRSGSLPRAMAGDLQSFEFEVIGQRVVLRGEVPSEGYRRRLVETMEAEFGSVSDELHITHLEATELYRHASESALQVLGLLVSGKTTWREAKFGVEGVVAEGQDQEVRRLFASFSTIQQGEFELLLEDEASRCDSSFASILDRSMIQFSTNSATISRGSFPILEELAEIAKNCPVTLQIEGHTDDVGPPEFNEALSQRRADAVGRELEKLGVDDGRLAPVGYGPRRPIADNETPLGRAKNRRIEIRIRR